MNILVVDDEPMIVLGISKRIRDMKDIYTEVAGAYSGEEALVIMEDFIPNLLITDIEMPDMNGLNLIEKTIKKGYCYQFLVLTAHAVFEYAKLAIQYHVIDYMVKPVDWEILENHIRSFALKPQRDIQLESIYAEYPELTNQVSPQIQSSSMKKIVEYINAHYDNELNLTQLALYSGMSENYICNLFQKELNITFLNYVSVLRIKKSIKLLLTESDKTIREIAFQVGYRSERQLFRIFKTILNMTPQQFREKHLFP